MAHSSVVQKSEEKEELSVEFAYYALLTDKSTYNRWRHVGTQHSLVTDEEIACFLLKCYEKKSGAPSVGGGMCTTCRSLLKLSCLSCGGVNSPATSAATTATEQTAKLPDTAAASEEEEEEEEAVVKVIRAEAAVAVAADDDGDDYPGVSQDLKEPNPHQGMNLRSRRTLGPTCKKQTHAPKQRKKTASARKMGSSEPNLNATPNNPSAPSEQTDLSSSLKLSTTTTTETSEPAEEKNIDVEDNDDNESCSQLPDNDNEEIAESKENAGSPESSGRPPRRAGRGRPRKYPDISLECGVCHRKLSTRASVVNHMKRKHPESTPVEMLDIVTSPPKRKKEAAQERVDTEGDDGTEAEAEDSSGDSRRRLGKPRATEATKRLRKAELATLKCATCGAQFAHKRQMYTHRRLCVSKVCHLCGRSVKQLEMHLKRHTSARRFPCPHCPKSFLFRNYLDQHLLYHRDEKPYCCEICGVRYREKTRLNAHIRTHTGSKPYKCGLCEAAFTRPRGLNDHMRVHTGEKPYSCQVCARQFSSSGNLAAHRRKVHGLQPQVPNRMTRKLFEVDSSSSSLLSSSLSQRLAAPALKKETFLLNGARVPTNIPVGALTGADVPEPVVMSGVSVSAGVLVGVPPCSVVPVSSGGSLGQQAVFVSADIPVSLAGDGVQRSSSSVLVPTGSVGGSSGVTLNSSGLVSVVSDFPGVDLNL